MPFNSDVLTKEVDDFGGAQLTSDAYDVPPEKSLFAQNVEFISNGEVKTRFGHSLVFTPGDHISAMGNWLFEYLDNLLNYLVYFAVGIGVRTSPVNTPGSGTIMPNTTAAGAAFAPNGQRLYAAFYNAAGQGVGNGQVYSIIGGDDPLFRRGPLTTEVHMTFTEGPAKSGTIVAGPHRFGFYLVTKNGYATRLSPLDLGVNFIPQVFTASGNRNLVITISPQGGFVWPTGAQLVLVMTTATNLNKYLTVPGPLTFVAGSLTVNIPVDVTDEDLAASGTDVTLQQTIMSQTAAGGPPFVPSYLFPYGERLAYVGLDPSGQPVCFFSEPSQYQWVTVAQHGVYLPGSIPITMGFSLRGVAYLLGPHWSYSVADNGGVPATWASPQLVDGSIGVLGKYCVWLNASQGFAWIADTGGLYLFSGGQYPYRPVSYYQQTDWNRINFAAPNSIFVVDDKDRKRVIVYAPLDGATVPTHMLTWYYVDGVEPEQVDYTIDPIAGFAGGAMTLIEGSITKGLEIWLGASSGGTVIRRNNGDEPNPYRDVNQPINSILKPGLLPGLQAQRGTMMFHHADQLRVKGNGGLGLQVQSLDGIKTLVPAKSPIPLSLNMGLEPIFRYSMMSENISLEMTNNNQLDAWFWLTRLQHYYTMGAPQR